MNSNLATFSKFLNYLFPKESNLSLSIHSYIQTDLIDKYEPFYKILPSDYKTNLIEVFSLFDYRNKKIDSLIYRAKFFGELAICDDFVDLFIEHLGQDTFDLITFVPSDPKRVKGRGYHIPQFMAKKLAKRTNNRVYQLLRKSKTTKPQVKLTKKQRLKNLEDIFTLNKVVPSLQEIKYICIIDDVSTTGATLFECAKVLKANFPHLQIYGLVVASA